MAETPASLERAALEYHEFPRPGKVEITPTKSLVTQHDLALAYTPGVAVPCLKIEADPDLAYRYTNRGNLVGVISNGTAVLGLGNIGALSGKPVMEGKAVLFKKFAGIDVFDIEIDETDPDALIDTIRRLAPTFGGINLEDIKAPECFYIEQRLKELLDIPVFHDDQHGTAIISSAALLNAVEVAGKEMGDLRVVVSGAGASGIACTNMFVSLGVDRSKVVFCDSKGVIYKGRTVGMNPVKERVAADTSARTLGEAMKGADVFLGLSGPDLVTKEMVRSMAERPIVFAMANPDPEISYPDAVAARDDVIMATGRSDYPNQVNNVLGFPFIFRGALDVGARAITEGMKRAAAEALAALAREDVPESVMEAYGVDELRFGSTYLIPKPFDHRVLLWVAPAVASAAVKEGVARVEDFDAEAYRRSLEKYLGGSRHVMAVVAERARRVNGRVAFAEGDTLRAQRAAARLLEDGTARPLLVGDGDRIRSLAEEHGIDLEGMELVDPRRDERLPAYAARLYELRCRRGMNVRSAEIEARRPRRFALLMLDADAVDCVVTGINVTYPNALRDALQIIGTRGCRASALHLIAMKDRTLFVADTSINIDPSARELADITIAAADTARAFDFDPRVAMLSFSTFGSVEHPKARRVIEAVEMVRTERPDIVVDGEMHVDVALSSEVAERLFPHSRIQGDANVLVCPDLSSANIAYKFAEYLAGGDIVGPILLGMRKPVVVTYQSANA
ncbi:MAG: NADP-dependent malic enzyme, partial [Planctomycetota bacterium]